MGALSPFLFRTFAMNLGLLFLESLKTGIITNEEMAWVASHQGDFSRIEEATAIKLGRLLDRGLIRLGCRL
ncbi:Hypothetical protein P9211_14421 [Prochlorococcus marinus str. MIT 9211]|uniref:Uncharacterized protein n=2 Tax=Prochlorococcus marinus TaxID=1219 RepID=A9BC11_PROM4|nr:Hypothetical protein P9211_14421 [Prochlorococcus marinus str. MIT 9211]